MIKNTWNRIGIRFIDLSFLLHEYTDYKSTKTLDYMKVSIENMDHGSDMEISVDKWDDRGGKSVPVDK